MPPVFAGILAKRVAGDQRLRHYELIGIEQPPGQAPAQVLPFLVRVADGKVYIGCAE